MEFLVIPFFGFPLLVLLLLVVWYNGLVRARNFCEEAWADIDTELKRRYDLIPNLVEAVKGYAKHEQTVLVQVVEARNRAMSAHASVRDLAQDENQLIAGLRHLFAVVENYPELKASTNFLHLQQELVNTEDRIQRARRFYNGNVRDLNNRIETFPSNLVAGIFQFQKKDYFEIDSAMERIAPTVAFS